MEGSVDILHCSDADFDIALHAMDIQELVTTISSLQSAMSQEQRRFDQLQQQLSRMSQSDGEKYNSLSNQLMQSQLRLSTLVSRNVKCFQQQTTNENQQLVEENQLLKGQMLGQALPFKEKVSPTNSNSELDDTDSGVDADFSSGSSTRYSEPITSSTTFTPTRDYKGSRLKPVTEHVNTPPKPKVKGNRDSDQVMDINYVKKQPVNKQLLVDFDTLVQDLKESSVDDLDESNTDDTDSTVAAKSLDAHGGGKQLSRLPDRTRQTAVGKFSLTAGNSSQKHVISNKPPQMDSSAGVDHSQFVGVKATAAIFAKLGQDSNQLPKTTNSAVNRNKKPAPLSLVKPNQLVTSTSQSESQSVKEDVQVEESKVKSPGTPKRVKFAPDTEFHERENPKPKAANVESSLFPQEGEPDEIETYGDADVDGAVEEGEADEEGMTEWVDVGTYSGIPGLQQEEPPSPPRPAILLDPAMPGRKVTTSLTINLTTEDSNLTPLPPDQSPKTEGPRVKILNNNDVKNISERQQRITHVGSTKSVEPNQQDIVPLGRISVKSLVAQQEKVSGKKTEDGECDIEDDTEHHHGVESEGMAEPVVEDIGEPIMDADVSPPLHQVAAHAAAAEVPLRSRLDEVPLKPQLDEVPLQPQIGEGEEKVEPKASLVSWDPHKLLEELYRIPDHPEVLASSVVYPVIEGYLEKLPLNKTKNTLLKTWKRRYFKAHSGCLQYLEPAEVEFGQTKTSTPWDSTTITLHMTGGTVSDLEGTMLGIEDGKGKYLVVRCPTVEDAAEWKRVIMAQTVDNTRFLYVQPTVNGPAHPKKKVVVVDMGSSSIRAGILREQPSLPELFFPSVMAVDKETGTRIFGLDAYRPEVRARSKLVYPIKPSTKLDKYAVDIEAVPLIFEKVFRDLKVDPSKNWVMISSPGKMSDSLKEQFVNILVNQFKVCGVHIANQTVLTLYSYSATSGIAVNVGDRLEIMPVADGYVMDAGVSRQKYGGSKVADVLNQGLMTRQYRFHNEVERLIVRYTMEKTCYVTSNLERDLLKCNSHPDSYTETVNLAPFDLPSHTWSEVTHDMSRFYSPEGIFDMELWEMDFPAIHKLVHKAIQACPMDHRKEMCRSIYLSGGTTMLPGFQDRLQLEMEKLLPHSIKVQVHASPHRYHAAYIGACRLAGMPPFEQAGITAKEWKQDGVACLEKWAAY